MRYNIGDNLCGVYCGMGTQKEVGGLSPVLSPIYTPLIKNARASLPRHFKKNKKVHEIHALGKYINLFRNLISRRSFFYDKLYIEIFQYRLNLILSQVHFPVQEQGHRAFRKPNMFRKVFAFYLADFHGFFYRFPNHSHVR